MATRVLVVDDHPLTREALVSLLGAHGFEVAGTAADGAEAIARARDTQPDLVLLDLSMPGMDGATVCRRIRDEADTPIIVVSGERDRAATVELLDLGADD